MYNNDYSALTFERNAVCVTADYGLNAPHNISVYDAQRTLSPRGPLSVARAYAIHNEFRQGELEVYFPGATPDPCMAVDDVY
jgi:lipocalin